MSSLLMDVVRNDQEAVGSRVRRVNCICKVVLCVLDQRRRVIVIIVGIKIEEGDMITKVFQRCLASSIAGRVWWSHVGWEKPDDVTHSHFKFILVFSLGLARLQYIQRKPEDLTISVRLASSVKVDKSA